MSVINTKDTNMMFSNYSTLDNQLNQIISTLKKLNELLSKLDQLLEIPDKVANALTDLSTALEIANVILLGLSQVPYINVVATPMQKAVEQFKRVVSKIKDQVVRINKQIEPYRDYVKKAMGYIKKIIGPLEAIKMFLMLEGSTSKSTSNNLNASPDSRYKRTGLHNLNELAKKLNQVMSWILKALPTILEGLVRICEIIDPLLNMLLTLEKVIEPIVAIINDLDSLTDKLRGVEKILNKEISFGLFSISIMDLLTGPSSIPFFSILEKIALKILDPLLSPLKKIPLFNIPGLSNITSIFETVLKKLCSIKEIFDMARSLMTDATGKKSVIQDFKAYDVQE